MRSDSQTVKTTEIAPSDSSSGSWKYPDSRSQNTARLAPKTNA